MEVSCEFLRRLIDNAAHPVCLIVGRHSVHRSKKVREFVASAEGRLKLFYLPPYSPELNPDELVWNYLKNYKIGRQSLTTLKDMKERVMNILGSLAALPEKVSVFFRHPIIKGAEMFSNLCTD